jgi:hypothetical protein
MIKISFECLRFKVRTRRSSARAGPIWDRETHIRRGGVVEPFDMKTADALSWLLDVTVTSALSGFGPRLNDKLSNAAENWADLWSFVPLYSIMMAELFNHIVSGAPTRRCANTRCNQLFAYQQGRVTKGTGRSRGVLYCSASCARAVAQRAYRQGTRPRGLM